MRSSVFCLACAMSLGSVVEVIAQPVATRFSPPVWPVDQSRKNPNGYYNANPFLAINKGKYHMGEDWNGNRGGNTDYGKPVYPVAVGKVVKALDQKGSIGKVVTVKHRLPDNSVIYSLYFHLSKILVAVNDIIYPNKPLGNIGDADGKLDAHLHLEFRRVNQAISSVSSGNLTIATFEKYLDPSRFIDDRTNWVGFSSCDSFASNGEFVVPDYAPASLAYMTYAGQTLSLPRAIDSGWIDETVEVWSRENPHPESQDLADFVFGPTTEFEVTLPAQACNLTILVPGHNFQKSRARADMVRAASRAGFTRIKLETFSELGDDGTANFDLRSLCFDRGLNTSVGCFVQATEHENPLRRFIVGYDPSTDTIIGRWTELDPNVID